MKFEQPQQENNIENKRINFELDVEGIKIPCWKEEFSYQKDIQKETQIEGYEKIRIAWKDLFDYIKNEWNITENISDNLSPKEKFYQLLRIAVKNLSEEQQKLPLAGHNLETALTNKLLGSFSNGEFPQKTFNHSLYGDHDYPIKKENFFPMETFGRNVHSEFLRQDALLGKIDNISNRPLYDSVPKVILGENGQVEFYGQVIQAPESAGSFVWGRKYLGENKVPEGMAPYSDGKFDNKETLFTKEEFNKSLKSKIFLDSIGGLNIRPSSLWTNVNRPTFGFDVKESPFSEYLKKINYLYKNIPSEFVGEHNKKCVSFMVNNDSSEKFYEEINFHPFLPIMTGNTGLPELRWGHCKYAVIPTSDSINLITLKHIKKLIN
jgi:hypothetical protein